MADLPAPEDPVVGMAHGQRGPACEVLDSLFERIHFRQYRKIEGYTPRSDRANRVRLLINTAFD